MSWTLKGSYVETCSCDLICPCQATRSRINAFGIEYEGKTGLSKSDFSWAA
jgi:hypothetical protein